MIEALKASATARGCVCYLDVLIPGASCPIVSFTEKGSYKTYKQSFQISYKNAEYFNNFCYFYINSFEDSTRQEENRERNMDDFKKFLQS